MSTEQVNGKNTDEEEVEKKVSIPIRWGKTEQASTIYANHLFISHAGNEFYLVFGELAPPTPTPQGSTPDFLEIRPVIKIVVSPPNMLEFADVINENIEKFLDKRTIQVDLDEEGEE